MRSKIYLYSVDNLIDNVILPKSLLEHINTYKIDSKRRVSMSNYMHLALKLNALGLDINTIEFTPHKKPLIKGAFISMSHSNSLYGFMISDSECGFDIEELIDSKRLNLAKKILSDNEYFEFQKASDKSLFLTKRWVLKEAYSKISGEGLSKEIFSKEINGNTLAILNNIIGYLPDYKDIEIYLNDSRI